MRQIKLFVIPVVLLLAFLCLVTVFLPSNIMVAKTISINAGQQTVLSQLNNFNNWKNWYPLFQDKNIDVEIHQSNDTPYAVLTRKRNDQLIFKLMSASPGDVVVTLSDGENINEKYQFIFVTNANGQTQLTWDANTSLQWYPWKKLAGIFMDKIKGPQYEEILKNLKTSSEKVAH
jgi:hypothetical protein